MPTLHKGDKDKVGFHFDKDSHTYTFDGKRMTGVTSVISVLAKPALIGWAAKMTVEYVKENAKLLHGIAKEDGGTLNVYEVDSDTLEEAKSAHTKKKEAAGTHGTDAHALVEEFVNEWMQKGKEFAPFIEKYTPIKQFTMWAIANVDHFLFSERKMFDKELFIAGTADFAYIGKDGKRYMADFKTSSGIYGLDYWLQTAAYRMLAEGEGDEAYDGCVVVRMGKDGSFEVNQLNEYVLYRDAFLSCLQLYRLQAHNKPEVREKVWGKK